MSIISSFPLAYYLLGEHNQTSIQFHGPFRFIILLFSTGVATLASLVNFPAAWDILRSADRQ